MSQSLLKQAAECEAMLDGDYEREAAAQDMIRALTARVAELEKALSRLLEECNPLEAKTATADNRLVGARNAARRALAKS